MNKYDYLHALYQELKSIEASKRKEIIHTLEKRFSEAEKAGISSDEIISDLGPACDYARKIINDESIELLPIDFQDDAEPISDSLSEKDYKIISEDPETYPENKSNEKRLKLTDDLIKEDSTSYNPKKRPYETYKYHNTTYRRQKNPLLLSLLLICLLFFFNILIVLTPFILVWCLDFILLVVGTTIFISSIFIVLASYFSIGILSLPNILFYHPILLYAFCFLGIGCGGLLITIALFTTRLSCHWTYRYALWNIKVIRGY